MSADGLYYLPDGFRESGQGSGRAADAAESTRHYLGRATPNAASYAGADEFVTAVTNTRDTQSRGVAGAAEGRDNMAASDYQVAALGEETEAGANTAIGAAALTDSPVARGIADGI
ncbi:hypothetical protein [Streptomyces litchfieldiae]|uniref:Uncharacterized protein n=1 Tax=Streptomyces litchfieldiae TaxID=3075543 RepID=A0ABU2MZ66_9ACTN|nr:hypothetical protein [Streptomyces sp. DSM 44938]MDT0346573.1 hypothetical protein [Streptomyces sp. DSM 44938]